MQKNKHTPEGDFLTPVIEVIGAIVKESFLCLGYGVPRFLRFTYQAPITSIATIASTFWFTRYGVLHDWHLKFLVWLWPGLFQGRFLKWLYHFPVSYHFITTYVVFLLLAMSLLGVKIVWQRRKLAKGFESIGLKNSFGVTPQLSCKYEIDPYTEMLGSRIAMDLPNTQGRGVWQHGVEQVIVQAPFFDDADIEDLKFGGREIQKTLQPMLAGPRNGLCDAIKTTKPKKGLVDANE